MVLFCCHSGTLIERLITYKNTLNAIAKHQNNVLNSGADQLAVVCWYVSNTKRGFGQAVFSVPFLPTHLRCGLVMNVVSES